MAKFYAGQTVVCIDDAHKSYLTKGDTYTVLRVSANGTHISIINDYERPVTVLARRFQSKVEHEQEKLQRFEPGEVIPVPVGSAGEFLYVMDGGGTIHVKPKPKRKTPRSIKIDPKDAKAALTKMLKEVYGIDATVEQVIGAMDKSLELVLGA
ncbi:hypothetical protein GOC60_04645 [Sinorhizobium meliloti]|nr:hypothetical protein [Sinorhizobium meliloti]MDX0347807.1 hypothetical protein [Sinorhizobium meliloti]